MSAPGFVSGQLVRIVHRFDPKPEFDGYRAFVMHPRDGGYMVCVATSDRSCWYGPVPAQNLQAIEPSAEFHLPMLPAVDSGPESRTSADDVLKLAQARAWLRKPTDTDPRIAIAQALAVALVPILISEGISYLHRHERMTEVAVLSALAAKAIIADLGD